MTETDPAPLIAYEVTSDPPPLVPAARARAWMDATNERFAYRCLPLVIANQAGWDVLCPASFTAAWDGSPDNAGISIDFHAEPSQLVHAHFGAGILTFSIGYLFRTPPDHNLWVRGPVNEPRDGIAPLEGIVETDWAPFTFTMNWKFTRPGAAVTFARGERICRLLPYPRHYLGRFRPEIRAIGEDPALCRDYHAWVDSRNTFNAGLVDGDPDARRQGWQRSYMLGRDQSGRRFERHETRIDLPEFERRRSA